MSLGTGAVGVAKTTRRFPTAPVLVLAGSIGLVALAPAALAAHTFGYVCPVKALTGLDCPGCGITRACASLAHGDLYHAADHNLLFVAGLPFLMYAWLVWFNASVRGKPTPMPKMRTVYIILAITAVFTIVRNIPGVPFLGSA